MKPKALKCRACRKPFIPSRPLQVCCSLGCAIALKGNKEEVGKVEKKIVRKWKSETKEKGMTHGDYENLLQTEINTIVRLIDRGHVCISHGKHGVSGENHYHGKYGKVNAGHYHSVGSSNSLRFHLEQIWLQCEHCNGYKGSNRSGYDKGLVETFGQEYWLYINQDLVRTFPLIKLQKWELQEKIKIAREIVKELKAKDTTYSAEERIELRKKYNQIIGIYK